MERICRVERAVQVAVAGIFSDWPATVTFYANCRGGERWLSRLADEDPNGFVSPPNGSWNGSWADGAGADPFGAYFPWTRCRGNG